MALAIFEPGIVPNMTQTSNYHHIFIDCIIEPHSVMEYHSIATFQKKNTLLSRFSCRACDSFRMIWHVSKKRKHICAIIYLARINLTT